MRKHSMFLMSTLLAASMVLAADTTWQGGDGSWNDETKWSNGVPTTENGNNAVLTTGGTINFGSSVATISSIGLMNGGADKPFVFTADSDEAGLTINGEIDIGRVGDGTLTYARGVYQATAWVVGCFYNDWARTRPVEGLATITNATVTFTGDAHIGTDGGHGTVTVGDGGKLAANNFYVGNAPANWDANVYSDLANVIQNAAVGNLVVTNGELSAVYGLNIASGLSSTGTVTVAGTGKVTTGQRIQLATAAGANAKLLVKEDADITSVWHLYVGGEGVADTTASVEQTGGMVKLGDSQNLVIGNGSGSVGTYDISGGVLTMPSGRAELGTVSGAKGVLNVSGSAIVTNNSSILVGSVTGAEGELTISGGEFYAQSDPIVGLCGQGTLNMKGGYMKVAGTDDSARWIKMNNENIEDFTGTSAINLDGGVIEVQSIKAENTNATAVINCNGGTLKSHLGGDIIKRDGAGITVNIKAGGLIVDVPEGKEATVQSDLNADESMGGIVKKGKGTLQIDGNKFVGGIGFIKVEEGTLYIPNSALSSADKVVVSEGATLNLGYNTGWDTPLQVRSLANNGTIIYGTITQMENPPTLTKAVWTGARSDDVNDPANWAVYYNDGEKDVRVSATELPTENMEVAFGGTEGADYSFSNLWYSVTNGNATVTNAVVYKGSKIEVGGALDITNAKLVISNPSGLTANAKTEIISATSITGTAFTSVEAGNYDIKVEIENDKVYVTRRGGFVILIAENSVTIDNADFNTWLEQKGGYTLSSVDVSDQGSIGISPLEAYLLGYDTIPTQQPTMGAAINGSTVTLSFGGNDRTIAGLGVSYSIKSANTYAGLDDAVAAGDNTLDMTNAQVFNRLVAQVVANP